MMLNTFNVPIERVIMFGKMQLSRRHRFRAVGLTGEI